MSSELEHALWLEHICDAIHKAKFPYRKGGAHGVRQAEGPFGLWLPPTPGQEPEMFPGFDCSGGVCSTAWHAGILNVGGVRGLVEATNTVGLEHWGYPGVGQIITLRNLDGFINGQRIEHCFWQLRMPGKPQKLWAASSPIGDPPVGWFHATESWVGQFPPRRLHP